MARRVLVVDDLAEVRTLVRRALNARGYHVDGAATLAEARQLNPAGYDALLVDSRLAGESGADLVESLRAQDPALARRCVIMTGGGAEGLPGGVTYLTKPFQLSDLLTAVRAAAGPEAGGPGEEPAASGLPAAPAAGAPVPDSAAIGGSARPDDAGLHDTGMHDTGPHDTGPAARPLLRLMRLMRDREHSALADYLHDGPIQELTAAYLEVQLLRQSAGSGREPQLASVQAELESALTALRALMDGLGPRMLAGGPLPDVIRRRTAWLLAAAADVTADAAAGLTGPARAEPAITADVTDAAELLLLVLCPAAPGAAARIAVQVGKRPAELAVTLTPGTGEDTVGDRTAADPALRGLAAVLGARLHADLRRRQWQVRLALAGEPAAAEQAAEAPA